MSEGISAKNAGPAPLCECHGEKMRWQKNPKLRAGGSWKCAVRARAAATQHRRSEKHVLTRLRYRDRERELNAARREANRDRINERSRSTYRQIMDDPEKRERRREYSREYQRQRYATDPAYRERCIRRATEAVLRRYDADPIWRIERNLRASAQGRAKTLARKRGQLEVLRAEPF